MNKTWNLNLPATDNHPATTLAGISQEDVTMILRGLMYGPASREYAYVEAARATAVGRGRDAHESLLAA